VISIAHGGDSANFGCFKHALPARAAEEYIDRFHGVTNGGIRARLRKTAPRARKVMFGEMDFMTVPG
jgi:hypothetical protein